MEELLAGKALPHAIVCGSDAVALGVISALRAHSIAVPGDVAVTGFDGLFSRRVAAGGVDDRQPASP